MKQPIQSIERLSLLLVGVLALASLALWDLRVTLGVALGGCLATFNFYALRRLVQAIVSGNSPRKQLVMVMLLTLKFGLLAASIYLTIKLLPVSPLALLVGMSVVVVAIFAVGFRAALGGTAPQSE